MFLYVTLTLTELIKIPRESFRINAWFLETFFSVTYMIKICITVTHWTCDCVSDKSHPRYLLQSQRILIMYFYFYKLSQIPAKTYDNKKVHHYKVQFSFPITSFAKIIYLCERLLHNIKYFSQLTKTKDKITFKKGPLPIAVSPIGISNSSFVSNDSMYAILYHSSTSFLKCLFSFFL